MASNDKDSRSSRSGSQATDSRKSKGQRSSTERGAATNHKKNPGKRASQGGSSR